MDRPSRIRLAVALASLELLAGLLLIIQGGALLSVDRPVPAPSPDIRGKRPTRPGATVLDAQWRVPARKIAQDLIAPPQLDSSEIERIEPRPPLSELGLAVPPKTPMPQDWREVLLYAPIASSSAIFESMGRTVVISGVQSIDMDKTCSFHDVVWPCGQRARAAFNSWLRGRALKCFVRPEVDRFAIAAPCRLGRQDVGAWLVSNGWALSLPSGIYGKAEMTAMDTEMGIFGPPR
ncbi:MULTISPECIES: thermonuclease family protein [unclassified Mesorhizobium]|uniref:thermonuclease family protein n=1 Tax=unclassified Mesorhizobium TaxID=325217 RepID=UPI000F76331E|nr:MULTISPECIES: thermonuclease family protein [unclassified Mesorhizobium]AZO65913.1 thermonuclease family protein [Mesorhizobium sp. M6A.T.Cr.TU.016.01.1.1]RWP55639.1 MAG: thermonuclease family protein [Mesorhizobium sp.]